jgi:UDP-N-acetylmuramoyl-tripeptide--D-alanyl-D-alanine ligase
VILIELINIDIIKQTFFTLTLALYLIVNLQWYNYSIIRVLFKHHKKIHHFIYFIIPLVYFYLLDIYLSIFYIVYFLLFLQWYLSQDKKLVITAKIKRFLFFIFLIIFASFFYVSPTYYNYIVFPNIIISILLMNFSDILIMKYYLKKAKNKLQSMDNLIIIAITASYGKTSIKNFLFNILKSNYQIYKSPKSVNTINGIIQDINQNLDIDTQIYIVEAGARRKGDILQISNLLNHHYAVIGDIGEQHIEYFKSYDNILNTKFELLKSNRLKKSFIHKNNKDKKELKTNYEIYGEDITIISSNLDGISFEYKNQIYKSQLLGSFNADNLAVCIDIAKEFNVNDFKISKMINNMPFIPHRLQRLTNTDKIIIDDSFNGNYKGINEAITICSTYNKRKIIITCGLVESTDELNIKIAKKINDIFDKVIVTSSLNREIFKQYIKEEKIIILKNKKTLEKVLKEVTKKKDLILFSNDAPSYI